MAKNATLRASYLEVPLYLYINIKSFQSGQKPIEHAETVDSQWTVSGDICVLQRDRHRTGPLSAVGLQSSLIFVEVSGGFCFSEE